MSEAQSILIVDDEEALLEVLADYLSAGGFTVHTASSQQAALELGRAHAGEIKLVIMDVIMPDELGPVIVDKLLCDNPTLRVLYLSGVAPNEDLLSGMSRLPMAMLHKPCPMDELERTVVKLLNFRDVVDDNAIPLPPSPQIKAHTAGA